MAKRISIPAGGLQLSAITAGSPDRPAIVLLHGWPLSSAIWEPVMEPLARDHFVLAFDLPGVGQSRGSPGPTLKTEIAGTIISAAEGAGARDMIIAGVDVGGMIAFAAARDHGDRIAGAVIMNTVIPGLDPWEKILANPQIWHFAFHQIPTLPETLVHGHERQYFDFFLDFLAGDKSLIDENLREAFVAAYSRAEALKAGFDWYRTMPKDAEHNSAAKAIETPILYLRGDADGREIDPYVQGLRKAGAKRIEGKVIAGSGEILSVEAPDALVDALLEFAHRQALSHA